MPNYANYDALLARSETREVDPTEVKAGMMIIGTRETIEQLIADETAETEATYDQALNMVRTVVSCSREADGTTCTFLESPPDSYLTLTFPDGSPVLILGPPTRASLT